MNIYKKLFQKLTGYWIHKQTTLPIGVDFFYDVTHRLKHDEIVTVFDVGANEGQTLKWVKHHQPGAHVYCFEPVQSTFKILKANGVKYSNVIFENCALGNASGSMKIRLHKESSVLNSLRPDLTNNDLEAEEEEITIRTVDEYCLLNKITSIDLLKIDTEGFEMNVLKGALEMLKQGRISMIICEVGFLRSNTRNTYFSELAEFLATFNYIFYGIYQLSDLDWEKGNSFANGLFVKVNRI